MKLKLITVGTQMPSWVKQGYEEYAKRIPHPYTVKLIEINAAKRDKHADITRILEQEAKALLSHTAPGDYLIALDARGQLWSTEQLADQLEHWSLKSASVCLFIGGPEGFAPTFLDHIHQKWSLSALTLPHPLVRILVIEQLYRAWSILKKHPYHRA